MSNQVYSNDTTEYPIRAEVLSTNVNCINLFAQSAICDTLAINNPVLDNLVLTPLVYDFGTSEVRYADNFVQTTGAQTLSDKTLTSPIVTTSLTTTGSIAFSSRPVNVGVLSFPEVLVYNQSNGLMGINTNIIDAFTPQPLANKQLNGANTRFVSSVDSTKQIYLEPSLQNTGTITTLRTNSTVSRTVDFPDASITVVGTNNVQTLSNKTLANPTTTAGGNFTTTYFTGVTTVGAVSADVATIPIPLGGNLMLLCNLTAKCTASTGADLDKIRSYNVIFSAKNIAGVTTSYTLANNASGDIAYAPAITFVASGSNAILRVTGLANDTISYAGIYQNVNTN